MNCRGGNINGRKILIPVVVAPPPDSGGGATVKLGGLVDTGAEVSCITPALAERLKVNPVDKALITSGSGPEMKSIYHINIHIPPPQKRAAKKPPVLRFRRLYVAEFYGGKGALGMILGMDLIMQGYLEVNKDAFTFCL